MPFLRRVKIFSIALAALFLSLLAIAAFSLSLWIHLTPLVPYTRVTEEDAKSFIKIGEDSTTVLKSFGPPNIVSPGNAGSEVWEYLVDPRASRNSSSNYGGFEVFISDKKVTYLGIIRAGSPHSTSK